MQLIVQGRKYEYLYYYDYINIIDCESKVCLIQVLPLWAQYQNINATLRSTFLVIDSNMLTLLKSYSIACI